MLQAIPCTTISASNTDIATLLTPAQLQALDRRLAANAAAWLEEHCLKSKARQTEHQAPEAPKAASGRKANAIANPFFNYIGCTTHWGRYPRFAMDIVEGIARLDWYDRSTHIGGKSMPLSVRNIMVLLESLPVVTNDMVRQCLHIKERHARRYVKAVELIIPWMMKCRPQSLINEMDGVEPEPRASEWEDDLEPPSPEAVAKLHHALRTLEGHEEYDAEYDRELGRATTVHNVVEFLPTQKQHPQKAEALTMLMQQTPLKTVARELAVARNTVRKWQRELLAA